MRKLLLILVLLSTGYGCRTEAELKPSAEEDEEAVVASQVWTAERAQLGFRFRKNANDLSLG